MKKRLFSVAYMFALTLFFTSVVSAVKHFNEGRIEGNERVKLQGIILDTLGIGPPAGVSGPGEIAEFYGRRVRPMEVAGRRVYAGYDEGGETVVGYAVPVAGPGFWGPIEAVVAVDAAAAEIVGVNFYRHSETPGLGARMTEDWFRRQFRGLRLDGAGEGGPFFSLVPAGTAAAPGELDAITGATQTSLAVERFLNRELADFVRSIPARLREEM